MHPSVRDLDRGMVHTEERGPEPYFAQPVKCDPQPHLVRPSVAGVILGGRFYLGLRWPGKFFHWCRKEAYYIINTNSYSIIEQPFVIYMTK